MPLLKDTSARTFSRADTPVAGASLPAPECRLARSCPAGFADCRRRRWWRLHPGRLRLRSKAGTVSGRLVPHGCSKYRRTVCSGTHPAPAAKYGLGHSTLRRPGHPAISGGDLVQDLARRSRHPASGQTVGVLRAPHQVQPEQRHPNCETAKAGIRDDWISQLSGCDTHREGRACGPSPGSPDGRSRHSPRGLVMARR